MLEKFSHIVGQDLPVMGLSDWSLLVIPIFFARRMMVGKDTRTLCLGGRYFLTTPCHPFTFKKHSCFHFQRGQRS